MIEAEIRGYYCGDLASRFTRKKQLITGASLFLSSGAAASILAKTDPLIPLILAALTAFLSAYSTATSLDRHVLTLSKLSGQWLQLRLEYENLWHHWYEDGAREEKLSLFRKDREASELGTTEVPYNEKLLSKWFDRVTMLRGVAAV
jgi:hypothetical protein